MASTTLPRVDCSVLQVQAGIHARASRSPARRLASAAPRPPAAAARARMGRRGRHQRSLGSGVRARRSHAAALGSAGAFAGAGPAPGAPCGPPGAGRPLGVGGPAQVTPRGPAAGALLAAAEQVAAGAGEPRRGPLGSRRAAPEEWPPLDALDQRIASLQGKLGLSERGAPWSGPTRRTGRRRPVDLEAGEAQSVIEDFLARSAPSEASSRRVPGDGRWHPGGGGWPAGR
ncbi:unnamed protein product [Prorocentrum cordatum]|uniref:Uncharacterized protein n=1 Tax=Prorocentrum cordatum TaxID=2364126 RepID=A0ABN9Y924_9DINO|nr:unnamed protein product [Polarella glacialis]